MYEVFYNFKAEPFRLSPDHKFCYEHKSYAKARAYMAYAFKRAEGFVMITGRPGTGKTTLIGELVESLSKDRVCTANLVCTQLQADDLLKTVAFSFGAGSPGIDKAEMLQRLTVLLHRWHREGRRALLIVDEAQDLSLSAMEELRLLTNIQIGGQPLLQIFLVGQPELRDLILSPPMEQVHQRIVAASHIEGLVVEETEAYVLHRLSVVGWRGDPAIDRAIFPLIHKYSEGVPRRINLICSRLFLLGSVEQRHDIRAEDVRVVITELQAENLAAGTGIAQEDFEQFNEPEWVPSPQAQTQPAAAAHRLHAVDNDQVVANDPTPSDNSTGAKKKDFPGLNSSSDPGSAQHSPEHAVHTAYFEGVPEYDQNIEAGLFGAEVQDESHQMAHNSGGLVSERGSLTPVEAPPRSNRPVLLALVSAAILSLAVLAVYFAFRDVGSRSERAHEPTARAEQITRATAAESAPGYRADAGEGTQKAGSQPRQNRNETVASSALLPTHDQAELPQPMPKASSDVEPLTKIEQLESSGRKEFASATLSSADVSEARDTEAPTSEADAGSIILVNFSFDSDTLAPEAHFALDKAAVMLRENAGSIAAITGFTDNQGDEDYNLVLSRKRAEAVKQYLVNAGVEQERLRVEGRGPRTDISLEEVAHSGDPMEPFRIVQIELSSDRR